MTDEERTERIAEDTRALAEGQEPISGPLTLHECIARAIKYNLDHRLRALDEALAAGAAEVQAFDMLPRLVASAGYTARSNVAASSSQSVQTGEQSLEASTSQEQVRTTADLNLTWHVLDFGVSYIRARQEADRVLIAEERRRKVLQTLLQQTRAAYWRAVADQRMRQRLDRLEARIEGAIASARRVERELLLPPAEALQIQKTLLETLRQLQLLRRQMVGAKEELASLMNVPPGRSFELVVEEEMLLPQVPEDSRALEAYALLHRPELREDDYRSRISVEEGRAAILSLLPGLSLDFGARYDSNRFLVNRHWAEAGLQVTSNLLRLASAPAVSEQSDRRTQAALWQRRATHVAVLSQVQVARLRLMEALDEYRTAAELSRIDQRLYDLARLETEALALQDLELVRLDAARFFSRVRKDLAYADVQEAAGSLYLSLGLDPLPDLDESFPVAVIARVVAARLSVWEAGRFGLPEGPEAAPPPVVAKAGTEPGGPQSRMWAAAASALTGALTSESPVLVLDLGSHDSPERSREAWDRLVSRHPDLTQLRSTTVTGDEAGGSSVFRLMAGGAEIRTLARACRAVRMAGSSCIIRHASLQRIGP